MTGQGERPESAAPVGPVRPPDGVVSPDAAVVARPIVSSRSLTRAAVTGALVLAAAIALIQAFGLLLRPLALLLAAIVLAQAAALPAGWLQRWLPRPLAVITVYLTGLLVLAGIGWMVIPQLLEQVGEFITRAPSIVERIEAFIRERAPVPLPADAELASLRPQLTGLVVDLANQLALLPLALLASLLEIILVVMMSIWWLLAQPGLTRFTLSLVPAGGRERLAPVLAEMSGTMGAYIRAFLLAALLMGITTYFGLLIIGVDYPVVLALLAAVGEVVPIVGPFIAAAPALAVAFLDSPGQALVVLAFYLVLQQIESNLLVPLLVKEQADIPPILAVFALVVGAALLGILGALIAIPLAGALRVFVLRLVAPAIRRGTGAVDTPPDEIWRQRRLGWMRVIASRRARR